MPLLDRTNDCFRTNDRVALVECHGGRPAGARGRVLGRFAREDTTWLISFADQGPSIEVRADQIVLCAA